MIREIEKLGMSATQQGKTLQVAHRTGRWAGSLYLNAKRRPDRASDTATAQALLAHFTSPLPTWAVLYSLPNHREGLSLPTYGMFYARDDEHACRQCKESAPASRLLWATKTADPRAALSEYWGVPLDQLKRLLKC